MKAVIPAAGMGTRLLPATKAQPKEMLPVVDKPTIQYVIEEAVGSGIDDILIITGRWKRAVEDHFDRAVELENLLEQKGRTDLLENIQRISQMADIHYIRQKELRGLGDAIYCAKKHVDGEPFAVLLGDDIIHSRVPCTKQLLDIHEKKKASVIALERHDDETISRYGVVDVEKVSEEVWKIRHMVEKPKREDAPSDLAVMGRYILVPEIFDYIEKTKPGVGGEVQITDAISALAKDADVYGCLYEGKRYDIGGKLDWIIATIELALGRDDVGPELRAYLKDLSARL
jgi:UTP--glucose-1-phosphate uridylyltransferase